MTITQPVAAGSSVASSAWSSEGHGAVTPEERLLALVVYSQLTQADTAKESVNMSFDELAKLRQEVKEALDKAKEAQHRSGFWGAISSILGGDIGAIASAVAAVAAVVATGGAAAAVLAVVASAVSLASQHAKELGIPPEIAMGIGIVAAGAALCCGNIGGFFQASEAAKKIATTVKLVAGITAGVAQSAGAGTSIASGVFGKVATDAQADASWAGGQQDLTNMDIDDAMKSLAAALDQQQAVSETVSKGNSNHHASCDRVLDSWAGAT
jgi:hypothetical protein